MTSLRPLLRPSAVMIGGLLLLSMAGSAALAAISREEPHAKSPERSSSASGPVALAETRPASSAEEEFLGVILARASVDVLAPAEGRIRAMDVRLGDRIPAGGQIARLDLPDARSALEVADAVAHAAQVDLGRAQVEVSQAEEKLSRRQALSAQALTTGEDLAAARYQAELARVQVDAATARLREQRVQVDQLRQKNGEAEVRAPFEGIVATRYADPGARVVKGAPLVRLIAARERFVRFAVPEERFQELEVGRPVRVTIARLELMGHVEKVSPEIDPSSRMVFVEAGLEQVANALNAVLSGEMARVSLPAPTQK